jgi:hypothetical protein
VASIIRRRLIIDENENTRDCEAIINLATDEGSTVAGYTGVVTDNGGDKNRYS